VQESLIFIDCWISTIEDLTYLFGLNSKPEMDCFDFLPFFCGRLLSLQRTFWTWMSPAHTKDLVDLLHAQLVENMMKSISNSNQNMKSPFKKEKIWCKISKDGLGP